MKIRDKIATRIEKKRNCSYRVEGGQYLVSGSKHIACHKFPLPLLCKCCYEQIPFTRSLGQHNKTHIYQKNKAGQRPNTLFDITTGSNSSSTHDFYILTAPDKNKYIAPASHSGDWQAQLWQEKEDVFDGGIFYVFQPLPRWPQAIEYIVKGSETDEELEDLYNKGFTLIKVVREGQSDAQFTLEINETSKLPQLH